MGPRHAWLLLAATLLGCGDDGAELPPEPPPASGCSDPLEIALPDGSCIRPGIAPDGCAPGFVHDGEYGCDAVLPSAPCPPGQMAVPGETACRSVMPCGAGRFGDIPVEATNEYVDGSYTGGQNDGSEARPWTTITEAINAASARAIIAIAAGVYRENVLVWLKPVRLWGVCPDEVTIEAAGMPTNCPDAALCIGAGANGTEVVGVALSGGGEGLAMTDVEGVVVDRVRIHDCGDRGVEVSSMLGPVTATVTDSLIEQNREVGMHISGLADVTVERAVVRANLPRVSDQSFGRGINVQLSCSLTAMGPMCDAAERPTATVRSSLVEKNHQVGVAVSGGDITVESTVVRDTQPRAADQTFGRGINAQMSCTSTPMGPACVDGSRSTAVVRGSVVENNHEVGVMVSGADVVLESVVVRDTLPTVADQFAGKGVAAQMTCAMVSSGAICEQTSRSNLTMRGSLVDNSHEIGVFVGAADATLELSVLRNTMPRVADGSVGDGFAAARLFEPANASLYGVLIENSARAGLSNFGAQVTLEHTRIRCAAFELAGEEIRGEPFELEDRGDNLCGCDSEQTACKVVSPGLAPPQPL